MANNVAEFDKSALPSRLAQALGGTDANDDLSSGVSGGFSVISFRGSKWRVKHSGDETLLKDGDGETLASIRVVMLKANKHISKNYYEGGFVEGSTDAPSCWSVDGSKPDPSIENPIHPVCATCPKNQFGSRISDNGSKGKACSDSRRVAVVPEGDYENDQFGGPMLLRVPAASLSELAQFGKAMKAKGFPYNTIVTRISFDPDTAYPRLKFNAVRPINDSEADEIVGLLSGEEYQQKIDFVLADAAEFKAPAEAPAEAPVAKDDPTEFEEEAPAPKAAKPKAEPAPAPKAAAKPKAEPEPEVESEVSSAADKELEDILAKLDNLD